MYAIEAPRNSRRTQVSCESLWLGPEQLDARPNRGQF